MAKVSVIVPVYNVEQYLRECIDSILEQTFTDLELILIDDGSPDQCGQICDEYAAKDDRIIVLHKENGGVSSARNYGLGYASGEYITFCDSDDLYKRDWISQLVEAAEESLADVIVGGYTSVDEAGKEVALHPHTPGSWRTAEYGKKMEYCFQKVLRYDHGWEIWDRLFRREIIYDNQIRFCETCGNYAEDLGFTLCCSMYADRVTAIDSCGYMYRVRAGSMMQNSVAIPKLEALQQVFLSVESICKEVLQGDAAEEMLNRIYVQMIMLQFLGKVWSSGVAPMKLREEAILRVTDWPVMEKRLRMYLRDPKGQNPYFSTSYNAEINSHIRFLLGGSWMGLRVRCKLIRVFRPVLDWLDAVMR